MAQDITADFRNVVEQKRKGHGDTRRSKLGRPTPGDADGAPPFMQAYMKEAYTIVSQVLFLFIAFLRATRGKLQQVTSLARMLAAVRRTYLDVHARLPPVTRQAVRALDTSGVDTWADIKYFTNAERDQIDVQAQKILSRCADRVHDMETLEKRASPPSHTLPCGRTESQTAQSTSLNPLIRFIAFFLPSSCRTMSLPRPTLYRLIARASPGI